MKPSTDLQMNTGISGCTLVIMAKAPRPGQVKTRLMRDLPEPVVTAFYRCLLGDTLALARSLRGVELIMMCPASDVNELTALAGEQVHVVPQTGNGLAAGLTSVFRKFAVGGRRVIAFNSDSPHLPASVLANAFDLLASHDVLIGPTEDGGYYLVGAKASHPTLFQGDGMGTSTALDRVLSRVRELQLSVGFTEQFYDIDVAADLLRLNAELERNPDRAPRTALWLKEWGHAVAHLRACPEDL